MRIFEGLLPREVGDLVDWRIRNNLRCGILISAVGSDRMGRCYSYDRCLSCIVSALRCTTFVKLCKGLASNNPNELGNN